MNSFIKFFLSNDKSILRIFQINEIMKCSLSGKSIEFGADSIKKKNFFNYAKGDAVCEYSNLSSNDKEIINIDITKKINLLDHEYDNVLIFNVLEHLPQIKITLREINRILKNKGKIIGSTPFLFRVHGAPKDYCRYTDTFLMKSLTECGFHNIKIKALGYGPILASFSLLRGLLKRIPVIYQLLLLIVFFIDFIIVKIMKHDPKNIYPVGYFFIAEK